MDEILIAQKSRLLDSRVADLALGQTMLACFDGQGNCLDVSSPLAGVLGYDATDILEDKFLRLIHPEDHDVVFYAYTRALTASSGDVTSGRSPMSVRLRFETRPGDFRLLDTQWYGLPAAGADPLRIVMMGADVTEPERALAELQSQAEFQRLLVDRLADGVLLVDRAGSIISANSLGSDMLRPGVVVGARVKEKLWSKLLVDDAELPPELYPDYRVFTTGEPVESMIAQLDLGPGHEWDSKWLSVSAQPIVRPGARHPWAVIVSLHDITPLREAEWRARAYVLELRDTLARAAREKEILRKQIATDFHDEPIQAIEAAKLAVGVLGEALEATEAARADNSEGSGDRPAEDPGRLAEMIEDVESILRYAASSSRRLISELRPRALDHGGLLPALASQLRQLSEGGTDVYLRTSEGNPDLVDLVRVRGEAELNLAEEPETDLSDDPVTDGVPDWMEMLLFRCAQRALRNVEQHAQASRVVVDVYREHSDLVVRVADDGVGFQPDELERKAADGHLGVVAMREEIANAGGAFDIGPSVLGGTEVLFRLACPD